jgi:hypothetical protein
MVEWLLLCFVFSSYFHRMQSFITMFAKAWILSCASRIQSTPSHTSFRYILILSFYLHIGLQSALFSFPNQNVVWISHFVHACYISHPFYCAWFNHQLPYLWIIPSVYSHIVLSDVISCTLKRVLGFCVCLWNNWSTIGGCNLNASVWM